MPSYLPTPQPVESMWGAIDSADQILPGIWQVSTPSHGGFMLTEQRQQGVPECLRVDGLQYEEDVHWAFVVLAFENEFKASKLPLAAGCVELAHSTVRNWHPDRYASFTGKPVPPAESQILRRRAAYEAAIGKLVVTSASGSWADWVPEGKVGVVARTVERVDHLGFATYGKPEVKALVDKASYDGRGDVALLEDFDAEIVA